MAWVSEGKRAELVQARFVALALELFGLRFFASTSTTKQLCTEKNIPSRSLRACRAELKRILPAAFKRTLAVSRKRNEPSPRVLRESGGESVPHRLKVKEEPDPFFDETHTN